MKYINVLVAGSGNVTGMNIIRALKDDSNIKVIGCDFDVKTQSSLWCENYEVPKCADDNYPNAITKLINEKSISHIIATNDHDVRALSVLKSKINDFPIFNGYSKNILACLDKKETERMFLTAGVETPSVVTDRTDYPYVLRKEYMGSNQKFVHIIKNSEDAQSIPEEHFNDGIMTRFVEGQEYTVDLLCDSKSNMLSAIPRKRIEVVGGMVHHSQIVKVDELIKLCGKIAKSVGLVGMSCIQCITDGYNYNFIEINPRPGSGIDLSINSGVNMPLLWIKESCGETFSIPEIKWGLQMKRYYSGYFFM